MTGVDQLVESLAQPLESQEPRREAQFHKTISFRLTNEELIAADALRSTFPSGTYAEAMRWIFSSSEGRGLIAKRVRGEV